MNTTANSDQRAPLLVLASQSPRRLELLKQIGFDPQCLAIDINEAPLVHETPEALVLRLACEKACAWTAHPASDNLLKTETRCVVLAADTVIDLDGEILGKPEDRAHALDMLQKLSGRNHRVHTGVCVQESGSGRQHTATVTTVVQFADLTPHVAQWYWQTGEPRGKAGSYAIQGYGAQFVVHLTGSYSNVVGLPLYETTQLLARTGLTSL